MSGLSCVQRLRRELLVVVEEPALSKCNQGSSARIWSSTDLLRTELAQATYKFEDRLDCYNEWLLATRQWLGQWAALRLWLSPYPIGCREYT